MIIKNTINNVIKRNDKQSGVKFSSRIIKWSPLNITHRRVYL